MRRKKGVKNLFIHISLALVSMILAFPFLWMFTNSIKTKEEIWAVPPRVWPAVAQWDNYADALSDGTFLMYHHCDHIGQFGNVCLRLDEYPFPGKDFADIPDHGDLHYAGYYHLCPFLCDSVQDWADQYALGVYYLQLCQYL